MEDIKERKEPTSTKTWLQLASFLVLLVVGAILGKWFFVLSYLLSTLFLVLPDDF